MSPATGSLRLKQRALALAQPLAAHLELTYRCNWRCVFCYNPRHHDVRGLATAEWIALLDALRRLGTLSVNLSGGEPLAHPGFLEIASAARARAFAVRVLTNGSLVSDAMADGLAGLSLVAVEMSLHGAGPETHDAVTGVAGSFDALLGGLDRLQRRAVRVELKTPLTRLNEAELEAMLALADALGVPYRVDPVITPRDDGDRSPLAYQASSEAVARLFKIVAARGQLPSAERTKGGVNCGLGRITLAIDPEGNVYPCVQWRHSRLGNVRETPLDAIWRTSPLRAEAAGVSDAANERLMATGGALSRFPFCPALALQRTGDALTPDPGHRQRAEIADALRAPRA